MATATRNTTWVSGQTLTAAALNDEFNNLLTALALTNSDVSAAAAIVSTKISFSTLKDGSGNTAIDINATGSAVNYIGITNAAADGSPLIAAEGSDTNINLRLDGKGSGYVLSNLAAPRGFLINGKIVPSVSSNNLTVAIKGLDGNDPSSANPVYCRIGDTVQVITSALSVTKNAGTNWFDSGGAEIATNEVDYFVYLGYNSTDGVTLGYSRLPFVHQYNEFSATSTNDRYCAISDVSNAAATDYYEVAGRFAATLSAGAGYTWTVPTFTAINLIQRPIYHTRKLVFTAVVTGFSSDPTSAFYYQIVNDKLHLNLRQSVVGTSNSGNFTIQSPLTAYEDSDYYYDGQCAVVDDGTRAAPVGLLEVQGASATINVHVNWATTTAWTASGNKRIPVGMITIDL